ncbi:MAG: protein-L-isoaspartate(D-aspartate) O-methyltransferase [Pseudomonadota bacterium]
MDSNEEMLERHLKARDIHDQNVLAAMSKVDRTLFVPDELKHRAYDDRPLPIGKSQTISQPYIVAYMAQALKLNKDDKVLEIGTGCGYNAAVLAHLSQQVYSIEIVEWLAQLAHKNLANTAINNVETRFGDGYEGWPEQAPFDAIELTAAPAEVPESLKRQLKIGGRLLAPVGSEKQELKLIERLAEDEFSEQILLLVRFVPMTGQAQTT